MAGPDVDTSLLRIELVRQQEDARATVYRGVLLIAVIPLILIAGVLGALVLHGLPAFLALLVAATYTLIGGIAGLATMIGGLAEYRRLAKQLRDVEERFKLPVARVVQR